MARYYRRGHWVNTPNRRASGGSGWLIVAVIAVALWVLFSGGEDAQPEPGPSAPATPTTSQTP